MTETSQSFARDYIERALTEFPSRTTIAQALAKFDFVPDAPWASLTDLSSNGHDTFGEIIDSILVILDQSDALDVSSKDGMFAEHVRLLSTIWLDRDIDFSHSLTAEAQTVRTLGLLQSDAENGRNEIDSVIQQTIKQAQALNVDFDEHRSIALEKANRLIKQLEARLSAAAGLKVLDELEQQSVMSDAESTFWIRRSIASAGLAVAATVALLAWGRLDSWSDNVSRAALVVSIGAFSAWFATRSAQARNDSRIQRELIIQARIAGVTAGDDEAHDLTAINDFFRKRLASEQGLVVLSPSQDRGLRALPSTPKSD